MDRRTDGQEEGENEQKDVTEGCDEQKDVTENKHWGGAKSSPLPRQSQ